MPPETTVFFVKPHVSFPESEKIYQYLQEQLTKQGDYEILFRKRFFPNRNFWVEFYEHMKTNYPKQLEFMANQFDKEMRGIDLSFIKGKQIIQRVKTIVGFTRYEDNPDWTIRGKWGPYEMPNTFVHASSVEEIQQDIRTLNKYFHEYIPININL